MYTIKHFDHILSVKYKDNNYVLGFGNVTLARYVMLNMSIPPYLNMSPYTNLVTYDEMKLMSVYRPMNVVVKKERHIIRGSLQSDCIISHMSRSALQDYPCSRMLGVILSVDVVDEDDDVIILHCNVTDPHFDCKKYRRRLVEEWWGCKD
jgi:hypothetical protein